MQKNIEQLAKKKNTVIAIIDIVHIDHTIPVIHALTAGGIHTIEVTLRNANAYDVIRIAKEHFPQLTICAGTVTQVQQLNTLDNDMIDFIISPGTYRPLLERCRQKSIDILPGIATPSDILLSMEYNLRYCKFFPAQASGGTAMLNALKGPFKEHFFCATGGIHANNYTDYLSLDNVFAVAGSWLVSADDLATKNWHNITQKCLAVTAAKTSTTSQKITTSIIEL